MTNTKVELVFVHTPDSTLEEMLRSVDLAARQLKREISEDAWRAPVQTTEVPWHDEYIFEIYVNHDKGVILNDQSINNPSEY